MTAYATYNNGELLAFLQNGDQFAFTEIYTRNNKAVFTYLVGYVKDPFLAEDLVLEVFIKLWTMREAIQIKSSFDSYLFRICHNMAVNALKRISNDNKLRNAAIHHLQANSATCVQASSVLLKYDRLLDDALNSLPPQCRRVFIL